MDCGNVVCWTTHTKASKQTDALIAFTFMTTILLPLYHQLMSIKHIKWFSLVHIEFYTLHCYFFAQWSWVGVHKNPWRDTEKAMERASERESDRETQWKRKNGEKTHTNFIHIYVSIGIFYCWKRLLLHLLTQFAVCNLFESIKELNEAKSLDCLTK